MASLGTTIQREATTVAWTTLIFTATGENPIVVRKSGGVDIKWKPGQAEKMEAYLSNIAFSKKDDTSGINVNVDLKPVIIPLVLKKAWIWVTLYTAGIVVATKLLSK